MCNVIQDVIHEATAIMNQQIDTRFQSLKEAAVHTPPAYPTSRPRRLRRDEFSRAMVRETRLHPSDLIFPVFVQAGHKQSLAVASMPGVSRLSLDLLLPLAEDCVELGIPVIALFPVVDAALKTEDGREAFNPEGLVPTVVSLTM